MKHAIFPIAALCLVALPTRSAVAQSFVHGTYYVCDINGQQRADELVENVFASVIDEQVSAGLISAWGWLSHYNGGYWRRVLYMAGPELNGIDDARNNLIDAMQGEHSSAGREFTRICGRHEDYIWTYRNGSRAADDVARNRPTAGLSVYLECDASQSGRLNELIDAMADTHNRLTADGTINSWAWWEHFIGGKYSNLWLVDGDDHKANMTALMTISAALEEEHPEEWHELQQLCDSHQDYMWDIKI